MPLAAEGIAALPTPDNPARLPSDLWPAVCPEDVEKGFFVGEMRAARWHAGSGTKFLTTIELQTCMALFAWARLANGSTVAFGAHVPKSAVFACWGPDYRCKSDPARASLVDVAAALRRTFAGVPPDDVEVHICGGYRAMDRDVALRGSYHEQPERRVFSWHMENVARAAGFLHIDTTYMNAFEGSAAGNRVPNSNFIVAALDLESGALLVHTDDANVPIDIVKPWVLKERDALQECWEKRGGTTMMELEPCADP